jgi:hypothetical protein
MQGAQWSLDQSYSIPSGIGLHLEAINPHAKNAAGMRVPRVSQTKHKKYHDRSQMNNYLTLHSARKFALPRGQASRLQRKWSEI